MRMNTGPPNFQVWAEAEKGMKNLHICPDDWWQGGEILFFTNYGPFFTASNAQTIKVKSIFHKWEDHMI